VKRELSLFKICTLIYSAVYPLIQDAFNIVWVQLTKPRQVLQSENSVALDTKNIICT